MSPSPSTAPAFVILTAEESAVERARSDRDWATLWQAIAREADAEQAPQREPEDRPDEEAA